MKKPLSVLAVAAFLGVSLFSAELSVAERRESSLAEADERANDWEEAGNHWELATAAAERADGNDRAIDYCERALAAWRRVPGDSARDRVAFNLGVISKIEIEMGRLVQGRERNLAALRIIHARIRETSGWEPVAGEKPTGRVPAGLLEAWARSQRDTANWLDSQGRTVAALELLTATDKSIRATLAPGAPLGFYHRKVLAARASFLKFLGYRAQSLAEYKVLVDTEDKSGPVPEWPTRQNYVYFSSQYYGPKPEYLDAMREMFREQGGQRGTTREQRRLLAKMAFAYGETGANVADLAAVIEEARAGGAELEAIYSQRDLALMDKQMGKLDGVEEKLSTALNQLRRRGIKRGEPTLYREYGDFLVSTGRVAEGVRMLHEAIRQTRAFGWTQHLPYLLLALADAQSQIGDSRGVTQTLAELDALLSTGTLVAEREFSAHCAKARILLLLGRTAEAEAALARAKSVAARAGLNEYQQFALQWAKDVKPMEKADAKAPDGIVDLQPVAVVADSSSDAPASAQLRLSNATANTIDGTLTLHGTGITAVFDPLTGILSATIAASEGGQDPEVPVQIGAGEEIVIKLASEIPRLKYSTRIDWKSAAASVHADCHFRPEKSGDAAETGVVVSNTSLAFSNPFYAVHLHHPIRSEGKARNIRVDAARRCRVEILNALTGAVLAVDADGDGAFTSRGDSVAVDADADGFPDLPADATTGAGEIELLVFPLSGQPAAKGDTRILLQVKTATGWQTLAHDTLKAPRGRR